MSLSRSAWSSETIRRIHADRHDTGPTPLRRLPLPEDSGAIWLKDESAHPTGSSKHRLVRAMYCHAVSGGAIERGTPVVVANGGPVAVAAAHFAQLLDLSCTAVVPPRTPRTVLDRISSFGGDWQVAEQPPAEIQQEAQALADRQGGHLLDHFAHAAEAVASCHEPTVADELFEQLATFTAGAVTGSVATVEWIVTGANTGATSATLGRHLRHHGLPTRLAVADPEHSAYFPAWASGARDYATGHPPRIPGIGRPRTEPGFLPGVLDLVIPVPDAASVAALHWLHSTAAVPAGPATGTALWAAGQLLDRGRGNGPPSRVVAIMGDTADAVRHTFLDSEWVSSQGLDTEKYEAELVRLLFGGHGGHGGHGGRHSG